MEHLKWWAGGSVYVPIGNVLALCTYLKQLAWWGLDVSMFGYQNDVRVLVLDLKCSSFGMEVSEWLLWFQWYVIVCWWVHLSVDLSLCPALRLSVCLSVCWWVHLSVDLSLCPALRLSVCLSVCWWVHLSVDLSLCPALHLSTCLSVCPSVFVE